MKVKKSKAIGAYIPTASMADIAFLLIVFFMVASVFPVDKTQVELPETNSVDNYSEDSAVITITTMNLIDIRGDIKKSIPQIYNKPDEVVVKVSDGVNESYEIFRLPSMQWDMNNPAQYDSLKGKIGDFMRVVERRRETEMKQIIIVVKADAKTPFYAVDGIIQALQDLGGDGGSGQGIAILSQPGG